MSATDLILRLLLAVGLGAALGLEREYRRKPAGLRTNVLIGFLGAGAILRSGGSVHGLTTAATIWVNAAIGMAAGAGLFAMATITATIAMVVLLLLPPLEAYFDRRVDAEGSHRHDRSG